MPVAYWKEFCAEIAAVLPHASVYYLDGDGRGTILAEALLPSLVEVLEGAKQKGSLATESVCAAWCESVGAAVLEDAARVAPGDLDRLRAIVDSVARMVGAEYSASRDVLTGLRNGAALSRYFETMRLPKPANEGELATSHNRLTLLALDVDHFKQVNDSYGHQWGDVVLLALALRLEAFADLHRMTPSIRDVVVSRPSGEEFIVVVTSDWDKHDELQFAKDLCVFVADGQLPDPECLKTKRAAELAAVVSKLPEPRNRHCTISIGVSGIQLGPETDPGHLLHAMRERSDGALYRAKSFGRNRACHYDDILDRLGRVVAHHQDANIVVIDLGKDAGVEVSQEFLVFHPEFTGDKPFEVFDGRSLKSMGNYPRLPSGRVEVVEVQEQVSFCRVHENKLRTDFPKNSHLQAVKYGDFLHLTDSEPKDILSQDEFLCELDPYASAVSRVVCCFQVRSNTPGQALLHDTLALLFRRVRASLGAGTIIGRGRPGELTALWHGHSMLELERLAVGVVESDRYHSSVSVTCGLGLQDRSAEDIIAGRSGHFALTCARAASQEAFIEDTRVLQYSDDVGLRYLQRQRHGSLAVDGFAFYKELAAFDRATAAIHNSASVVCWSLGPKYGQDAQQTASRAAELDPDNGIYNANAVMAHYAVGNYATATRYRRLALEHLKEPPHTYRAVLALTRVRELLLKEAPNVDERAELASLMDQARAAKDSLVPVKSDIRELEDEIATRKL
jgi:diguanylate cyclase (GGDEF)-like protein